MISVNIVLSWDIDGRELASQRGTIYTDISVITHLLYSVITHLLNSYKYFMTFAVVCNLKMSFNSVRVRFCTSV